MQAEHAVLEMEYNPSDNMAQVQSSLDTNTDVSCTTEGSAHELRVLVENEEVKPQGLVELSEYGTRQEYVQNKARSNADKNETFRNASACKCIAISPVQSVQARIQKQSCQDGHQRVLKFFDQDNTYGPSSGVTREERIHRARHFGINIASDVGEALTHAAQD